MSSVVKGQANLQDCTESNSSDISNKRKRAISHTPPKFNTGLYPNIQYPSLAPQELTDHPLHTDDKDEKEASALLLLHHADPLQLSEDPMHVDSHPDGNAAMNHRIAADHHMHMLQHLAQPSLVREHSGSPDHATGANYFSGDSDVTAELIMGGTRNEDGSKSSNSATTTPPKLPRTSPCSDDHGVQALAAELGQDYSINLPSQQVDNTNNDKDESSQTSATAVVPSTSTTYLLTKDYVGSFPASTLLSSSKMNAVSTLTRVCHGLQADCEEAGRGFEHWLQLRLGYSNELQQTLIQHSEAITAEGRRKSRESSAASDEMMEASPVTLQLLPEEKSMVSKASLPGAAAVLRSCSAAGSSGLGNLPAFYHPTATAFSNNRPIHDKNQFTIARIPSDHQQLSLKKSEDLAAALLRPTDHRLFVLNQNSGRAVALQRSNAERLAFEGDDAGIVYDQGHRHDEMNDQRKRSAADTSYMPLVDAMTPAASPNEVYRPTTSLGVHATSAYTRPCSANAYTPNGEHHRTISWQGLLRSMATEPFLHGLPELPICSLNAGTELAGSRGRNHMFTAACRSRPPSSHTTAASHQRHRLATSRRSAGLWFSLQEAHDLTNETVEQHGMQKLYLRIRDGKMQISVLKSYVMRKLTSSRARHHNTDEVEITCRGKVLAPTLTIQQVRDKIWLSKDVQFTRAIGFRYSNSLLNDPHNRVMALCYHQRHHTQTVTLNLLKA